MLLNIRSLMDAAVHFGHSTRYKNPKMAPYIYCERNKISVINLEKTLPMLKGALKFVDSVASRGGKILFVGTKRAASELVAKYAEACNMPYVDYRWLGGMLTNYKTIKKSVRRLADLKKMQEDGTMDCLTKKERLALTRQITKLEQGIGGIKGMSGLPDAIFVVDVNFEMNAVKEANKLKIPVIGVVDTNSSPEGVDYIIPGNDDAIRAINLYLQLVTKTILSAKKKQNTGAAGYSSDFVEQK